MADGDTKHQRVIDVMNACAAAGCTNVTIGGGPGNNRLPHHARRPRLRPLAADETRRTRALRRLRPPAPALLPRPAPWRSSTGICGPTSRDALHGLAGLLWLGLAGGALTRPARLPQAARPAPR
ncbi:MAG: hypothetical protein U1F87_00720 [Kiritimatiellia bacterium]